MPVKMESYSKAVQPNHIKNRCLVLIQNIKLANENKRMNTLIGADNNKTDMESLIAAD